MNGAAVFHALMRAATAATMLMSPADSGAQQVRLEVRPKPGDTLRITIEHAVTTSAAARTGFAAVPPRTTSLRFITREVVEGTTAQGTSLIAIIDSASAGGATGPGPALFPHVDRTLHGTRVHTEVSADGASTVTEAPGVIDGDLRALIGEMPSVLPTTEVAIGASWTRDMPLPMDGSATRGGVAMRATIRLDSLTADGALAWISLKGALGPVPKTDTASRLTQREGTLDGSMVLDRKRGWLLESHTTATIETVVAMPNGAEPLVVKVRVVQSMKTASARR